MCSTNRRCHLTNLKEYVITSSYKNFNREYNAGNLTLFRPHVGQIDLPRVTGDTIDGRHEDLGQNGGAEKEEEQLDEVEEDSKLDGPRLLINEG